MKDLIERLRRNADWLERDAGGETKRNIAEAADLLERIYSQPVELPGAVACLWLHNGEDVNAFNHPPSDVLDGYWLKKGYTEAPLYTADQLTQAVQEATARVLEAAAKKCDARYMGDNNREDMEARRCAAAIRNLIGRVK